MRGHDPEGQDSVGLDANGASVQLKADRGQSGPLDFWDCKRPNFTRSLTYSCGLPKGGAKVRSHEAGTSPFQDRLSGVHGCARLFGPKGVSKVSRFGNHKKTAEP